MHSGNVDDVKDEPIEQLPGQMNIYDYHEFLSKDMRAKVAVGIYKRGVDYDRSGDMQGIQRGKE